MFTGNQGGDGEHDQVTASESPAIGFRNLGLGEMEGGWCIPAIPPDLFPTEVSPGDEHRRLASFSLYAHKRGIRLPNAEYVDLAHALQAQLTSYYMQKKPSNPLPAGLEAQVSDGILSLSGIPQMNLPLIYLKPVFQELESLQSGLGHFVSDSIGMGHGIGITTYNPERLMSAASYAMFYGAETDDQMLLEVIAHHEIEEGASPEEMLEMLRNEYPLLPSDLIKAMGPLLQDQPRKPMSLASAKRCLACDSLSPKASLVLKKAIKFRELRRKIDKLKLDFFDDFEGGEIGALAFVVWDDPDVAQEIVEHYERDCYESTGTELLYRVKFNLNVQGDWDRAINAYTLLIQAYAVFSELLTPMEQES